MFISYHHGGDQQYYDAFSSTFSDRYEVIYDHSLERRVDSENTEYVIRRIRENYIHGSSCTIVLVGAETWGRKYVDWEIKATLAATHGLIGVQLPTARRDPYNGTVIVPDRLADNIHSCFALWLDWSEITASAAHLDYYVTESKSRRTALINNTRDRRFRNA